MISCSSSAFGSQCIWKWPLFCVGQVYLIFSDIHQQEIWENGWRTGIPCKGPCTASSETWCRHCLRTALRIPAPPGRRCCGWPEWSACAVDPWPSGEKEENRNDRAYTGSFVGSVIFLYRSILKQHIHKGIDKKEKSILQPTNLFFIAQNDLFKVTHLCISKTCCIDSIDFSPKNCFEASSFSSHNH